MTAENIVTNVIIEEERTGEVRETLLEQRPPL
jgi:hypothetical protein